MTKSTFELILMLGLWLISGAALEAFQITHPAVMNGHELTCSIGGAVVPCEEIMP